jgi:hypothetical protein
LRAGFRIQKKRGGQVILETGIEVNI